MHQSGDKVVAWAQRAMGWINLAVPGAEADDLAWAVGAITDSVILTSDTDWIQVALGGKPTAWYRLGTQCADRWVPAVDRKEAAEAITVKLISGDKGDDIDGLPKTAKTKWGKDGAKTKIAEGGKEWVAEMRALHPEHFALNIKLVVLAHADLAIREACLLAWSEAKGGECDKEWLWKGLHKESFRERMIERFGDEVIGRTQK